MVRWLRFFRLSGTLEAVSYLILLLVAMPLKYIWKKPIFVSWTGRFHGVFFLLFLLAVLLTARKKNWSLKVTGLALLSAFIPFGPFIFERYFMPSDQA